MKLSMLRDQAAIKSCSERDTGEVVRYGAIDCKINVLHLVPARCRRYSFDLGVWKQRTLHFVSSYEITLCDEHDARLLFLMHGGKSQMTRELQ